MFAYCKNSAVPFAYF